MSTCISLRSTLRMYTTSKYLFKIINEKARYVQSQQKMTLEQCHALNLS